MKRNLLMTTGLLLLALLGRGPLAGPAGAQLPFPAPTLGAPPPGLSAAGDALRGAGGAAPPAPGRTAGATGPAQGTPTPTGSPCPPGWTTDTALPGPRSGAAVAVLGGYLYEAAGYNSGSYISAAARYSGSGAWDTIASIPTAVEDGTGVTDGAKFYVVGGYAGGPRTLLQIYDPASDSWSQAAPLPLSVAGAAATYYAGKIYVMGGCSTSVCTPSRADLQIYTIATNSWSSGAPLLQPNSFGSAVTIGNYLYLAGDGQSTQAARYDPVADVWDDAAVADLPESWFGAASAVLDGQFYLFGGDLTHTITNKTIAYDPVADTWTYKELLNTATYRQQGGNLNGVLYIVGGFTQFSPFVATARVEAYRQTCGTPSATPGASTPTATPTLEPPTLPPTITPLAPTATATAIPPTRTPTSVASATRVPATATALPPTRSPTSVASATRVPATATALPPTSTATPCSIPFSDVLPADYFYTAVQDLYCHGVISGYGDNTFRPYSNTTRSQMVKIVVLGFGLPMQTPPPGGYTFADVPPSHPFFAVVETAAARNIVGGYTCGGSAEPCDSAHRAYFRPYTNVTRGQLSKIDVVAAGWPMLTPARPTFTDVAPGSAFYLFVETAVCHGVVSGYADHTFHPGADATRGQIAKIVYLSITNPPGACASAPRR